MRSLRSAARCMSLVAFLCMHWHGGSALAKGPHLPEVRIELTGRLTSSQRAFVLRLPELERDRRDMVRSLLRQRIYWGEFDLDDDGIPERIIMIGYSTMFGDGNDCGKSRCSTLILTLKTQGWKSASHIRASRNTLRVLPETDRGWRRLYDGPDRFYKLGKFGGYVETKSVEESADDKYDYRIPLAEPAADLATPPRPGTPIRFKNDLSAAQRNFVRTHPEFQWMHQEVNVSLIKKWIYWADYDLNGDGIPERIILVEHGAVCGTAGCNLTIWQKNGTEWIKDSGLSGHREYFVVLPETDSGWHRLDDGSEILTHLPCGYFSQEIIDDDASVGSNPCRNN